MEKNIVNEETVDPLHDDKLTSSSDSDSDSDYSLSSQVSSHTSEEETDTDLKNEVLLLEGDMFLDTDGRNINAAAVAGAMVALKQSFQDLKEKSMQLLSLIHI